MERDILEDYMKQYRREYYQKNKEYFKQKQIEWRKNNPERARELAKKHRNARAERLIAEGVTNPWSVIVKGNAPKYKNQD
jgi:hypothetical protein